MTDSSQVIAEILKLKSKPTLSTQDKNRIQKLQQSLNENAQNPVKFI